MLEKSILPTTTAPRHLRVAVVGSSDYPHPDRVAHYVQQLHAKYPDATVVSGHGGIVDLTAERQAYAVGMKVDIYRAKWRRPESNTINWKAGFERNGLIVANCDIVVAFWDGRSNGTRDTMGKAMVAGKRVFVAFPGKPMQEWKGNY